MKQTMHKEVARRRSNDEVGPRGTTRARKRPGGGPAGPPWLAEALLE